MTPDTLCELFQRTVSRRGSAPALSAAGRRPILWSEYGARVEAIARGLLASDVGRGEPVALLTDNTPEFHLVDTALMHVGAVPFSLHGADPIEALTDRLQVAGSRLIFAEPAYLQVARSLADRIAGLQVVALGPSAAGTESLAELEARGAGKHDGFEQAWRAVTPDDLATLIFTSGSTGRPKAVQLPHRAITVSLVSFLKLAPGGEDGVVLSYLPLTHIAERFMSHYLSLGYGAEIHCVSDPDRLYDELLAARPTRFFGVPRVYTKLAALAREILAADPQAPVAAALGLERSHYRGVASAPSSTELLEFFTELELPVGDIWGMSEAIMCTTNPTAKIKIGTVGRLLDGVQGKVADDGELLVRGPNTFSGYLNDPGRTAEILDIDGWLHTGDLGAIDSEGYLSIIGRKKEIIITATGKNVAPSAVEAALRDASPLIDHAVAVGDGRRHVAALIALDRAELAKFTGSTGGDEEFGRLTRSPEVRAEIERAVKAANKQLGRGEAVRTWQVVEVEWLPGGDEITPTMKLRRTDILAKYSAIIESLYAPSMQSMPSMKA